MDKFWFFKPLKLFRAVVGLFSDWWDSRSFLSLLRGSPALIMVLLVFGVLIADQTREDTERIFRYERAAAAAVQEEDYDVARVCYDKLVRLDAEQPRYKYALAVLAEKQDQAEQARRMMSQLAPADRTGFGPAHYWLANDRLQKEEKTAEDVEFIRIHMLRAVDDQPGIVNAHAVLSRIYLVRREPKRAAEHLALVVQRQPSQRLALAMLYAQLGRKEEFVEQARLATKYWRELAEQNPTNVQLRLKWAQCETLLQNHPEAARILQTAMASQQDDRYRQALAGVLAAWSDRIPPENLSRKLELLQQALSLAPESAEVLQRLAPFAVKENPNYEEVRKQLHEILARGKAQATVHMILGTIATQEDDFEAALFHLEQAHQQNARMPQVSNNLAWVLAHRDPPDLERALKLADVAVELAPRMAAIRETRGVIHIKMKQWKKAITDLEMALPLLSAAQQKSVHEHLALAYEQIGNEALAESHRKLAE